LSIDTITKKALHAMQVGNYRKAMKWVVEAQKNSESIAGGTL